jgi:anti-sigma regulatory factor (Ser/Thr protein kinase)
MDMDTLSVGHPIFELAYMYNAFQGFSEMDHEIIKAFQGFDYETGAAFWRKSLAAYLGTNNQRKIREVEDKARILGYARMIRRSIRRGGLDTEKGRTEIEFWKKNLLSLLERTDTLLFRRDELEIEADQENLEEVQTFIGERLEAADCPMKVQMQIEIAVEEVFINIASYAYAPGKGNAVVRVEVSKEPAEVTITFMDHGTPFDPLAREDPDLTIPAEDRQIGGLGVFMVKKTMDDVTYEYKDGKNTLTLRKNL